MSARFSSVLIANRGEIACRIIRAAREEGLSAIAVFSDADAGALHVRLSDKAIRIGPSPPGGSYLSIGALIDAAKATGAEALHPGYGFLAENADLAEACAAHGLAFVGPPSAAIRVWQLRHYPYLVFYMDREQYVDVWRVLHANSDVPGWMQEPDTML